MRLLERSSSSYLAALFAPKAEQGCLVIAHDDPCV